MSAVSAFACSVFLRGASAFPEAIAGLCLVAFTYGGCLAVMPSLVADFYGDSSIGGNYGLAFSAWGICGFLVPGYFESLLDRARAAGNLAGGYHETYWTLAAFSIAAAFLASFLSAPKFNKASPFIRL
jgi:MFS family permease